MKQSKKLPAEKRREQLMKAAQKVITKKGYSRATTEEIAREAKLTKGALYFHFKNKEEVFFELIKQYMEKTHEFFKERLSDDEPIEKNLENLLEGIFVLLDNKEYFNLDFWQKAHKVPRIRRYLENEHNKSREYYTEFLLKHSDMSRQECEFIHDLMHIYIDGLVMQVQGYKMSSNLDIMKKGMLDILKMYLRRK